MLYPRAKLLFFCVKGFNSEPGYQVPVGTKDTNQLEDPPKTEETQPALLPYDIINCPPAAALDNRRLSDKYVRPDEIPKQHLVATNVIDNRSENFYENRDLYGGTGKRPTWIQNKRFYRLTLVKPENKKLV